MLKALLAFAGFVSFTPAGPTCALVPGWTQEGPARVYNADNLFEYMDGNSEGYLLYHFQEMHGVTCKQGETTFVLDISDMGEPDFSFGMFSSTRDLRQPSYPVGMGGQIVPRRLIFAKGKYYVEIAANPSGDYTGALKVWAAALDQFIPGTTSPPATLSWFPAAGQQSLRFVPESALGLRVLRQGYVAQYEFGKAFVVAEDTPQSAAGVMGKLRSHFGQVTSVTLAEEGFEATDRYLGRLCMFRKGRYVGGYAVTAPTSDPITLSRSLAAEIP